MEYAVGKTGRVIVARLFEGEDIYEAIESVASKENIKAAAVLITGGMRKGNVVVGPKTEEPKIEPQFMPFEGPGEVLGVGTIYWNNEVPKLHIHTAIGKGGKNLVGCPRGGATTFLVLEVTIIEIDGIQGQRKKDEDTGFELLRFQ
jgi:predicted DNA-binding protein with PD1-like motif